ncbi:MAG: DUF433 domain-containing protein [Chloroflexi bacterium]|nr:DUF433 domain-containing protein [Chloroflexota bacterium]
MQWQGFYSTAQVSRLAGIPRRTLYDWKARGIIRPTVRIVNDSGETVDEGYSYADLAIIKLMRALREKDLNLRSVAVALRHLYERLGPPTSSNWEKAHVHIVGKDVFAQKLDGWDTTLATKYGQKADMRVLGELTEEEAAMVIPKRFDNYIEIDLSVMDGQPVIRNTRVPTSILAMMHGQGASLSELAVMYAPVPHALIRKAIEFERSLDHAAAKAA